jgi:hypothetical protein
MRPRMSVARIVGVAALVCAAAGCRCERWSSDAFSKDTVVLTLKKGTSQDRIDAIVGRFGTIGSEYPDGTIVLVKLRDPEDMCDAMDYYESLEEVLAALPDTRVTEAQAGRAGPSEAVARAHHRPTRACARRAAAVVLPSTANEHHASTTAGEARR